MTYTKESGKKWENEHGKTSHMKVSMVHDEEECEKECTAIAPCIAFTFIPGLEICALKAPTDAVTLVPASEEMISGKLVGERPSVHGKELDSTICLLCLPGFFFPCNFYCTHVISHRVQHRGRDKAVWSQFVPAGCRDAGGMLSCMSSGA